MRGVSSLKQSPAALPADSGQLPAAVRANAV